MCLGGAGAQNGDKRDRHGQFLLRHDVFRALQQPNANSAAMLTQHPRLRLDMGQLAAQPVMVEARCSPVSVGIEHFGDERHAHQIGEAIGLHLTHQVGAIDFHGAGTDAEVKRDLLVSATLEQSGEDVFFTRR
jgi:hypothetical protein